MPNARHGQPLIIRNQPVEFSFSPVAKTTRRYGLQTRVFTSDPWAVMAEGIAEKCPKASREAALAFNAQAEDFYDASQSNYTHRPSDELLDVTDKLRQKLWSSVLLHPPYRKYYLYLAPLGQKGAVLPQLLSMFVVIFFLGSITRYRPHHFERLLDSHYGAHLLGALNEVPAQFIYLLASEMLKREVIKASIAS